MRRETVPAALAVNDGCHLVMRGDSVPFPHNAIPLPLLPRTNYLVHAEPMHGGLDGTLTVLGFVLKVFGFVLKLFGVAGNFRHASKDKTFAGVIQRGHV